MRRRQFLGLALSGAAAFALDPERLLWVPGAKKIFISAPRLTSTVTIGEIVAAMWEEAMRTRGADLLGSSQAFFTPDWCKNSDAGKRLIWTANS